MTYIAPKIVPRRTAPNVLSSEGTFGNSWDIFDERGEVEVA